MFTDEFSCVFIVANDGVLSNIIAIDSHNSCRDIAAFISLVRVVLRSYSLKTLLRLLLRTWILDFFDLCCHGYLKNEEGDSLLLILAFEDSFNFVVGGLYAQ